MPEHCCGDLPEHCIFACPLLDRRVLAEAVYRIGKQKLEVDGRGRFFISIRNRTYASEVELPVRAARRYYHRMRKPGQPSTLTRALRSA